MARGKTVSKAKKAEVTPVNKKVGVTPINKKLGKKEVGEGVSGGSSQVVHCVGCRCEIGDDVGALSCERCMVKWKCCACFGIRGSTYEELISETGREINWYCSECRVEMSVGGAEKLDQISQMIVKMTDRLSAMEEKLEQRDSEDARIDQLEEATKIMEEKYLALVEKLEKSTMEVTTVLEKSREDVSAVLEKSKFDVAAVQGCVEGALKEQTRMGKEEEEDKYRRRVNVIIHGMSEPKSPEVQNRKQEDADKLQLLLHKLSCDDVSVEEFVRLGAPPTGDDKKSRSVRVTFSSEETRNRVLKRSKNLRNMEEMEWTRVFIHQDFTPKEREVRKEMLKQLKHRKENGEKDLILVNNKIVSRKNYDY
jgi:hypothetical protein